MTSDPVSVPAEERAMKALTLHQPWASLIAEGVKTIETRSWSTRHRGPIAIHAGKKIQWGSLGNTLTYNGDNPTLSCVEGQVPLPLGAIVATATLTDCVPMRTCSQSSGGRTELVLDLPNEGDLPHQRGGMWLFGPVVSSHELPLRVEDQLPFGDFAPGRWAWLLTDVVKLAEPIPAKGKQGLWTWMP